MSDDENLNAYADKSSTFPMTGSDLRKNGHVVIKGRPCKIVEISISKAGKHGHSKIHIVGIDLFTGQKLEDLAPSSHEFDVPVVHREEYQLDGVDNGYLLLSDNNGNSKTDVAVPEGEIGQRVMEYIDGDDKAAVGIISAMGEESCISIKEVHNMVSDL